MSVFDTLQGAVDVAHSAVDSARQAATRNDRAASASQQAAGEVNDRLAQIRQQLGRSGRPITVALHGPALQQLRSMMPNTFGYATFVRRSQAGATTHYLFGLSDLPTPAQRVTRYYGEYCDSRGRVLGSTHRGRVGGGDSVLAEHWVIALPANHSTSRLIGELNQRLNAAHAAEAAARTATAQAAQSQDALGRAVNTLEAAQGSTMYRLLNSVHFSAAVVMLEMWNVQCEVSAWEQTFREKGTGRTAFGIASAGSDLLVAMEALTVKLAGTQSALAVTRRVLFEMPPAIVAFLGKLGIDIVREVTGRLLLQSAAGLAFCAVSLYDAWYAWQWGDDALYGYLLSASGALVGVVGGWIGGSSATFLGLGPWGWLSLLLVGVGIGLVAWLSSTPLETWLKRGPFGEASELSAHLQAPEEAFYRLVSVLANIHIDIARNPAYEPNAKLDDRNEVPFEVRTANTRIRLQSSLPGLLEAVGGVNIQAHCRLRQLHTVSIKGEAAYTEAAAPVTEPDQQPVAQRLYPDALELYFDTPPGGFVQPVKDFWRQRWAVRAQFTLRGKGQERHFPAPRMTDSLVYSPLYAKANFAEVEWPFWADEEKY
ncbi:MAG: hypothetical protein GAK45_00199 [Pseudomonas citronellolis]|nr:MAG: hypothetical protein GAK45_00199 [Pseudomonas citronellolis]